EDFPGPRREEDDAEVALRIQERLNALSGR
ncbi:MAG: hypothetical protein RLZZ412_1507, partial [Verrucomicrobiota bacterium]